MFLKKFILLLLYLLISFFAFSQNKTTDIEDNTHTCKINSKNGIDCLTNFSQKNSNLNPDSDEILIRKKIALTNNKLTNTELSKLLFVKANIFFIQKKYVQAIKCHKKLIDLKINRKNYILKQEIYTQLGIIYQRVYYPKEALLYFKKSLEINNKILKDTNKICDLYVLLGHANLGLRNYEKSLNYYNKSLNLAKKTENNSAIIRAYINIGNLYMRNKKFEEAEKFTRKSLELSIENKLDEKITICYLNLAEIYGFTYKNDSAIKYYTQTIKSIKTKELNFIIPICYKSMALIYSLQNDYKNVENSIIKHYEHISNYDSGNKLAESLRIINSILKKDSNLNFANKYLAINTGLLDSILISENNNRILMIESLHALEKENLINQKQLLNLKWIIILATIILILLVFIIILLIITRKKILTQSKKINQQNKDIQSQNEEITIQNNELSNYKNHLEELVKIRTKELEISLEKAEENDRLKTNFLKNLSHEIRTPMNAILGFSQLLEFNGEDSNKKYIEIIDKNVNELLVFLDNIVELSKIQSGNRTLNIKTISILQFLNKIESEANYIKAYLGKDNIDFKLVSNQTNFDNYICTDEVKLYGILVQLLENAFKFTEKGSVNLFFELIDNKAKFIIEDTGIGIKKTMLPYIFDTFRKIEDDKKIFRGTGMGLALVKKIIELLDAEIFVSSETDKGSKFTIIIPNKE